MKVGLTFFPTRPHMLIPSAKRAEELGYESLWFPEHLVFPVESQSVYPYGDRDRGAPLPGTYLVDPFIAMSYVAALTSRIRLGTAVYILPLRNPITTARAVATLDVLSQGRVLLGIGAGWLKEEFEVTGEPFDNRGGRMDEMMQILKQLWTEPTVSFQGKFYSFPPVGFEPKPVSAPIPLLVGGETRAALRRAARLGDGWFGMGHTPESARERVQQLRELRAQAGREREPFEVTVGCSGPATPERLKQYQDAGVHRVTLAARALSGEGRTVEAALEGVERFADEVLSKLEG